MKIASFLACASLAACAAPPTDVQGTKPSYLDAVSASVPNQDAIGQRVWTPGIEEGYIPQGLTVAGDSVLVATYHAVDPKASTGPCRIYKVDIASGATTGWFDMPPVGCGHAGGLAYLGAGQLMVADTRQLYRVDLERAFATHDTQGAMRGTLKLAGLLRGSFAAFDGRDAWIGTWTREPSEARMFRLATSLFDSHDGQSIREDVALASIAIPKEVQGAAFDKDGRLWLSASGSKWGKVYRVDATGRVEAEHAMVAGVEDIDFDASDGLWAVSESGTRKYMNWETRFPFVFRIDVGKLR